MKPDNVCLCSCAHKNASSRRPLTLVMHCGDDKINSSDKATVALEAAALRSVQASWHCSQG